MYWGGEVTVGKICKLTNHVQNKVRKLLSGGTQAIRVCQNDAGIYKDIANGNFQFGNTTLNFVITYSDPLFLNYNSVYVTRECYNISMEAAL